MEEFVKDGIRRMLIVEREKFQQELTRTQMSFREEIKVKDRYATKTHTADMFLANTINNGHRMQTLRKIMNKFDLAMARVSAGTYGTCTKCGKQIPISRLSQVPFTEYCVKCKEAIELEERRGTPRFRSYYSYRPPSFTLREARA